MLTKHSDKTIQIPGKPISCDLLRDKNPTSTGIKKSFQSHWTRQLRILTTNRLYQNYTFSLKLVGKKLNSIFGWLYYISKNRADFIQCTKFFQIRAASFEFVINTLQINNCCGSQVRFLAVLIMSATGFFLK